MFERIERLKSEWTDKYVVVDARAPELARFARATGQVRTVNMNGRCLVEFDQYNNTGWYDIDPAALTVVPKPQPKAAEPKEKAKPAAAKPAAPPKPAPAAKPAAAAAKPAAGAARLSTAEILARARGAQAAAPATAPPPAPVEEPAEEAAAPQPVAPQAKKAAAAGPLPTSTAEKIAWCRAHDARG